LFPVNSRQFGAVCAALSAIQIHQISLHQHCLLMLLVLKQKKMHSHFGQAHRFALVIHLKFYGTGSKIKKLNDKYISNNCVRERYP
jgi:hypothetical protein